MEVIDDTSNSAFQKMQKILEFEDNSNGFDFSPNNFFYSNLKYLEQYAESNVAVDDQIIKTLRLYKRFFEQNVEVFEESILNSNLVNVLIKIILKIKAKLTNQGKQIAYCSNMLHLAIIQQQVFDILISLSKCSNLVILMILNDNKLFDNIASLSPTLHYSGQAISFLSLFHAYFEKFPNISYSYYIPNNFVNDIVHLANENQYFNSRTIYKYILIMFEDLLKYVELTIDDIDYMIVATLTMLFDFGKYDWCANACSLMKLFFKKCDGAVYAFTEDLTIPIFFFGVMKNFPENKNYTILCDICSVVNECFDYISDEQLKSDIIKIFEPEVIFAILKRANSKKINVTPIISLISRHFEIQKMSLDYFISSGGYDIVIEYLNDSTFLVYVSVLKLLCQMSNIFSWISMPQNSIQLFIEHGFDILTIEDTETMKIFCEGLNNALMVNDPNFHRHVLEIYQDVVGNNDILRILEVSGPDDIKSLVSDILRVVDSENPIDV